ncbi:hypothetical protein cypCar_00023042 [Cyprinus carpio]|nr:hypothetical protein cypCar_00023042 [Cyprinus carpio]
MERFYTCSCFFSDNIFLEEYKLHVRFVSENQFRKDYQNILRSLGCVSESQFRDVLGKIHAEIERRQHYALKSAERAATIKEIYTPLHQHVYYLQESFLDPEFLQLVKYCTSTDATMEGLMNLIQTEAVPRVFRFPVFRKEFCKDFIEELEHFEQSDAPKGRPNTMNNYGVPLSETECVEVKHHVTEGLLHRGQHMHGALPISSGTRWNLIIWMRASRERNKLCPMCGKRPTLVESDGFSDGFTMDPDDTSSTLSCSLT